VRPGLPGLRQDDHLEKTTGISLIEIYDLDAIKPLLPIIKLARIGGYR
jgi:hypothetical protein